jgi:multidrug transporter EmrE-like cation transporter
MLRGILEFSGSLLFLLSLKIALENSVNQGVCSAMVTLAGLMITLMSWYAYDEKLNYVQIIGLLAVLTAVIMMGFFT